MNRPQFLAGLATLPLALTSAWAQPAGQLYDPVPPADSGYVRVIYIGEGSVDVHVDGRARVNRLVANDVSAYMVLKAGPRELSLIPPGKPQSVVKYKLEVPAGKALTVAFSGLKSDAAKVYTDTANTNQLKAILAVYHLAEKAGPVDINTIDGKTKVFTNLAPGANSHLSVNPINVELGFAGVTGTPKDGQKSEGVKLSMTQGATYSLFVLPTSGGKARLLALQNKTERYTGK